MSTDAADLFCELFDSFEAPTLDPHDVNDWLTDDQVMDIASYAEGQVVETGTLDEAQVWDGIDMADEPDRRRFAYLQGIDNALLHAHPHTASQDAAGLVAIATRYVETGRFNTEAVEGGLVPRYAFPADPDGNLAVERLADAMSTVVRVPGPAWEANQHLTIPARSDFTRLAREQGVVFGCVPFLENLDELQWQSDVDSGGQFFRASLTPTQDVRDRIAIVLAALDASPAMVGVVPELCLTDEVLGYWREAIDANPAPRDSHLRWIFVGTGDVGGGDPPANRGHLLDRLTGESLVQQDKIHPFVLNEHQIQTWGLAPFLGDASSSREDIRRGQNLAVVESNLGRLAILICEDLARTMTLGPALREHGLSIAICPVFSEVLELYHWEHSKAKEYAAQVGTQMLVANSRAVGHAQGLEDFDTALAHSPFSTDLASAGSSEDVALLRLSDEAAVEIEDAVLNLEP
jgi:predicted amidohydrolase